MVAIEIATKFFLGGFMFAIGGTALLLAMQVRADLQIQKLLKREAQMQASLDAFIRQNHHRLQLLQRVNLSVDQKGRVFAEVVDRPPFWDPTERKLIQELKQTAK